MDTRRVLTQHCLIICVFIYVFIYNYLCIYKNLYVNTDKYKHSFVITLFNVGLST